MGDCRILASSIAHRLGGTVIAIGSEGFKDYPVVQQSDNGSAYCEIFNNPMHYVCSMRNGRYVDIYGVFDDLDSLLEHYNHFYHNLLPDINIDMREWPLGDDRECQSADPDLVQFIVDHVNSTGLVTYPNISNYRFITALQIIYNGYVYNNGSIIHINGQWVTSDGITQKPQQTIPSGGR